MSDEYTLVTAWGLSSSDTGNVPVTGFPLTQAVLSSIISPLVAVPNVSAPKYTTSKT